MIDRSSTAYQAAKDRVKVSHFTEQGYDITGLVHVGANDGYEVQYYLEMGIKPVVCFEPLKSARHALFTKYAGNRNVEILGGALGNVDAQVGLIVADGDGKDSSFLPLLRPVSQVHMVEQCAMYRYASLTNTTWAEKCNCLVIDVQGMELDVLRGMDDHLQRFDFLSVECSATPMYRGEAGADEVVAYLNKMGFSQDSPIRPHDDVMFIHRRVIDLPVLTPPVPLGNKLNIGSGQRRFSTSDGWVNIDCVSRPGQVPDLVCDVGCDSLPYPDASMDYCVLHQVYEHFGLGEGHGLVRECYRVLKPGGSLIVTVPDMRALAQRWLTHAISDYIYFVNVYGAYQGEPGDRHCWGYSAHSLRADLKSAVEWSSVPFFDWRPIPGAEIARDFWILGVEAVK